MEKFCLLVPPPFRGITCGVFPYLSPVPRGDARGRRTPRTALRLYGVNQISPLRGESFFRNFQKPYLSATSRNTAKLRSRPKMRAAASRMQAPACLNVRVSEPKCERSEPNLQTLPYLQQPLLQLLQPHNHLLF